jgi:hypothetical protein
MCVRSRQSASRSGEKIHSRHHTRYTKKHCTRKQIIPLTSTSHYTRVSQISTTSYSRRTRRNQNAPLTIKLDTIVPNATGFAYSVTKYV